MYNTFGGGLGLEPIVVSAFCKSMPGNVSSACFSCQTYEGGFGGAPGLEAHGGYSFCAFAALTLMNKENSCDVMSLLVRKMLTSFCWKWDD
jgi:prenyltransferase beta subunit